MDDDGRARVARARASELDRQARIRERDIGTFERDRGRSLQHKSRTDGGVVTNLARERGRRRVDDEGVVRTRDGGERPDAIGATHERIIGEDEGDRSRANDRARGRRGEEEEREFYVRDYGGRDAALREAGANAATASAHERLNASFVANDGLV